MFPKIINFFYIPTTTQPLYIQILITPTKKQKKDFHDKNNIKNFLNKNILLFFFLFFKVRMFFKCDGKKLSITCSLTKRNPFMSLKQTQQQPLHQNYSEEILVVRRNILFQNTPIWQGIKQEVFDVFVSNIQEHAAYIPRAHAETNESYKQIIPYMIFTFENKLFVMQRKSTASEQRLANKYSLGIGGHIRQEDITDNDIFSWAKREFEEEVSYKGSLKISKLGVLNDESTEVSKVHLGMVLLLRGDNDNIQIKDEHKSGMLLTLNECKALYPLLENWSQIVLDSLENITV